MAAYVLNVTGEYRCPADKEKSEYLSNECQINKKMTET